MILEPEVEEGEAYCYKDDASIDPDVALSYIGDKVQSILGHHQKDFEGEVSAANLGAKFGGYGSFLPVHQRSPVRLQPECPQKIQSPHLPKSPNHVCRKDPALLSLRAPDDRSTQKNDPLTPSAHARKTVKNPFNEASSRQNADEVSNAFSGEVKWPTSTSANPLDQTSLKVRIKVGSDKLAQYNAEIYNLGLTSPSSSEETSHDESDEFLLHDIPGESPANVLQIMTSFPVSGGVLLSPLTEDLMTLKSVYQYVPQTSAISVRLPRNGVVAEERTKCLDENKKSNKSEGQYIKDLDDTKQKILSSDNSGCAMQTFNDFHAKRLDEMVRESEKDVPVKKRTKSKDEKDVPVKKRKKSKDDKDVPVKKRKKSKDGVKGRASGDLVVENSLEHACGQQLKPRCSSINKIEKHPARISQKHISMDHGLSSRTEGGANCGSVNDCLDNFEGEGIKAAMDTPLLGGDLNRTSGKQIALGMAHAVNVLASGGKNKPKSSHINGQLASKPDSLRNSGCAAPEYKYNGKEDVSRLRLIQKDAVHTSSIDMDKPKHLLERSSVEKPRDYSLGLAKSTAAHADKLKGKTKSKENLNKVMSDTHVAEPQDAVVHTKGGASSGLELTAAAPVIIQDNWVCCDLCQKWRLLPRGTTSEQLCLPETWVCSMLNWLPGMNNCDVSEDETTNAIESLYAVPVPDQHNFHTHVDGATVGVVSAGVHNSGLTNQKHACDQMQKLKAKQNTVKTNNSIPSGGKKNLQYQALKTRNSKEVRQSLTGVNATNKSDLQHPNKSAIVVAKSNKRKGEFLSGDDGNPRKKIQTKSAQNVKENMENIKSKEAHSVNNLQTSTLKSGLPNKAARKDGSKKCAQPGTFSRGVANGQMCVKKQKDLMKDLPDDGVLGMKSSNSREESTKRIKLKCSAYSQHREETQQNNSGNLQDGKGFIKEDAKDLYFRRDKKAQMSQTEEVFQSSESDVIFKRKGAETRVQSLGSDDHLINGCKQKELITEPRVKRVTKHDIDKLRKDLSCEDFTMALTAGSSKVSDPTKNRIICMDAKGSPEESVSSHPMRMTGPNHVSPMMVETAAKVHSRYTGVVKIGSVKKFQDINGSSELATVKKRTSDLTNGNGPVILDSSSKLKEETDLDDGHLAPEQRISRDKRHRFSDKSSIKAVKNSTNIGKRDGKSSDKRCETHPGQIEHVKNDKKSSHPCSTDLIYQNCNNNFLRSPAEKTCTKMEPWNGKFRIDLRQGDKQGELCSTMLASASLISSKNLMDSGPLDNSLAADTSKVLNDTENASLQNPSNNFIKYNAEGHVSAEASLGNHNISGATACTAMREVEDVLKEAEKLKIHAALIKNSGFGSESNYEYFKAALKFLEGGSQLEACNEESGKHLEMTPMQLYSAAAKLCMTCACEFEKDHEMAAAALAYKCMEVSCLRVVYCKSSTRSQVWHDLQSRLQMVPQGESPSSSASDVDNLNNYTATLSKGISSRIGNYVTIPRNCPEVFRLLDFAKDADSAMGAAKKSQDVFLAANLELKESKNEEAVISIKRVLDLSFQNIEELIRMVWLAFNNINHQNHHGDKE